MNQELQGKFPQPVLEKNDKTARVLIWSVSVITFLAIAVLSGIKLNVNLPFNPHVFAAFNAVVNSCVAILLVAALIAVKQKHYLLHKRIMLTAIILSMLFLISYVCHHLFSGETRFGDLNHDGILSPGEKLQAGSLRYVYYAILMTHIPLAGIILPFILFTAYRALSGDYKKHKKLSRITWPIWFYVAVSGVVVYLLISPYYA
jgi:putative membrane protein